MHNDNTMNFLYSVESLNIVEKIGTQRKDEIEKNSKKVKPGTIEWVNRTYGNFLTEFCSEIVNNINTELNIIKHKSPWIEKGLTIYKTPVMNPDMTIPIATIDADAMFKFDSDLDARYVNDEIKYSRRKDDGSRLLNHTANRFIPKLKTKLPNSTIKVTDWGTKTTCTVYLDIDELNTMYENRNIRK